MASDDEPNSWPELSYERDHETFEALHLWMQIVGKVRLALTPWVNHSWHVPLYVTARGLTTSLVPHPFAQFDLEFDFIAGVLALRTNGGAMATLPLAPGPVASFYAGVARLLESCDVPAKIYAAPNELPDQIPFAEDTMLRPYDKDAARRLWLVLSRVDAILKRFRTGFIGKCSPVHFFWGSFDLAVTRFSGRRAPLHPGGVPHLPDDVAREAYSHEVSSAGFWSGGPAKRYPLFYSYAYPEPSGFREASGLPSGAGFDLDLQEYVLPYDAVRTAGRPEQKLLDFLQATYVAAAESGHWDRSALECGFGEPNVVRKI